MHTVLPGGAPAKETHTVLPGGAPAKETHTVLPSGAPAKETHTVLPGGAPAPHISCNEHLFFQDFSMLQHEGGDFIRNVGIRIRQLYEPHDMNPHLKFSSYCTVNSLRQKHKYFNIV